MEKGFLSRNALPILTVMLVAGAFMALGMIEFNGSRLIASINK